MDIQNSHSDQVVKDFVSDDPKTYFEKIIRQVMSDLYLSSDPHGQPSGTSCSARQKKNHLLGRLSKMGFWPNLPFLVRRKCLTIRQKTLLLNLSQFQIGWILSFLNIVMLVELISLTLCHISWIVLTKFAYQRKHMQPLLGFPRRPLNRSAPVVICLPVNIVSWNVRGHG